MPNEYLWKTHKAKAENNEKWEIYAWAFWDLLSSWFDLPENPQHNREKVKLQSFMFKRVDEMTVNGKTYRWPHEDNKKVQ